MSYLKEKMVRVEALGASLLLRELSALAQIEIMGAAEAPFEGVFIACKHGVVDWADKSIDDLKGMMTLQQASEVAGVIFEMSGTDAGN